MSEYACWLKLGTTSLVLHLIEEGVVPPDIEVADPLETLRNVSRDPTFRWLVPMRNGTVITAIELQRRYLDSAKRYMHQKDAQTDLVLQEWERILDDLERDPLSTWDRLDWSAKHRLYSQFVEENGVSWQDDIMQSVDLEYHNISPSSGLFYGLEAAGEMRRMVTDEEVEHAIYNPPTNTRAKGRGYIVSKLLEATGARYIIDWDAVYIERNRQLELKNPFHTYDKEAAKFMRGV